MVYRISSGRDILAVVSDVYEAPGEVCSSVKKVARSRVGEFSVG